MSIQSRLIYLDEEVAGIRWAVFKFGDTKPRRVFLTQAEALRWIMCRERDWLYSIKKLEATP